MRSLKLSPDHQTLGIAKMNDNLNSLTLWKYSELITNSKSEYEVGLKFCFIDNNRILTINKFNQLIIFSMELERVPLSFIEGLEIEKDVSAFGYEEKLRLLVIGEYKGLVHILHHKSQNEFAFLCKRKISEKMINEIYLLNNDYTQLIIRSQDEIIRSSLNLDGQVSYKMGTSETYEGFMLQRFYQTNVILRKEHDIRNKFTSHQFGIFSKNNGQIQFIETEYFGMKYLWALDKVLEAMKFNQPFRLQFFIDKANGKI